MENVEYRAVVPNFKSIIHGLPGRDEWMGWLRCNEIHDAINMYMVQNNMNGLPINMHRQQATQLITSIKLSI